MAWNALRLVLRIETLFQSAHSCLRLDVPNQQLRCGAKIGDDIEELLRASPCPGPGLAGASASDLLLHPTKDTSRQCQPCAFRCFEFQAPGVGQSTRDILMVRRSMCGILIFVSGSRESRMQMSQEEDLVVSFFVYEILTDEENHEFWFRHLELCSLNHFTSSAALLARIVESSFAKLKPRVQGQVIWLLSRIIREDISTASPVFRQLLRYQAFSPCQVGFFSTWLSENLVNLSFQWLQQLLQADPESLALLFYSSVVSARVHLHFLQKRSFLQPPTQPSVLDLRVQRLCSTQLMLCTRLFDIMPFLTKLVGKDILRILCAFSDESLSIPAVSALESRLRKAVTETPFESGQSASIGGSSSEGFQRTLRMVVVAPDIELWVDYLLDEATRIQLQWQIDWLFQFPRGPELGVGILSMLVKHPSKDESSAALRRRCRLVQGILDHLLALETASVSSSQEPPKSSLGRPKESNVYREALEALTFDPHYHVSGIDDPSTGSLLFEFLGRRQQQADSHVAPILRCLFNSPRSIPTLAGASHSSGPSDCLRDFLKTLIPSARKSLTLGLIDLFDAQEDVRLVYKLRGVVSEFQAE